MVIIAGSGNCVKTPISPKSAYSPCDMLHAVGSSHSIGKKLGDWLTN